MQNPTKAIRGQIMSENQMLITIIGPGIKNKSRSTVEIRGMQSEMEQSEYTLIALYFSTYFF